MTTALTPAAAAAPRLPLRSEWTKLTSLRSTVWSLVALIVVGIGLCVVAATVVTGQYPHMSPTDRTQFHQDTVGLVLQPALLYGQIAVCVLGVLLMASEFSTGLVRPTLLAAPRRTPVLAAKALTFGGLVFVLAELIAVVCLVAGRSITARYAAVPLDATTVRAVLGFGLYLALTGVLALCVGTLLRHPAAGISAMVLLQLVLPAVLGALPGSAVEHLAQALPVGGQVLAGSGHDSTDVYSPAEGLLILLGWTGLGWLLASASLKRRDV